LSPGFSDLAEELREAFRRGAETPMPREEFEELALRVFRFQCAENGPYGAFVRRRGTDPGAVERWEDIPAVPTRAFKTFPLVAGDPEEVERVFRTSGTTGGREARGEHHVRDLSLYREALLPPFRAHLLSGIDDPVLLALLPSPQEAPDSSLSYMLGAVASAVKGEEASPIGDSRDGPARGDTFFVDREGRIREGAFLGALRAAESGDRPVLLAGTAFAFVHWLEMVAAGGKSVRLPPGSRIMETGGFKGRSRSMPREELYGGLEEVFGVAPGRVVNEYGMTELLSQFYEPVLLPDHGGSFPMEKLEERHHRAPPWVRTRVLDPTTLEPLEEGREGILAHFDLANVGSVSAVLTEDLGRLVPGGFRLAGRAPGAEPRGCSLAMEAVLGTASRGRLQGGVPGAGR
jgi:hypothetical protein